MIPGLLALLRPIFGDCRSSDACRFRRDVEGLHERYGPFDDVMLRQAVAAVMLWRRLEQATVAVQGDEQARRVGKGRRPSVRQIERHAKRQGLSQQAHERAVERLEELAASRPRRNSLAALLAVTNTSTETE